MKGEFAIAAPDASSTDPDSVYTGVLEGAVVTVPLCTFPRVMVSVCVLAVQVADDLFEPGPPKVVARAHVAPRTEIERAEVERAVRVGHGEHVVGGAGSVARP